MELKKEKQYQYLYKQFSKINNEFKYRKIIINIQIYNIKWKRNKYILLKNFMIFLRKMNKNFNEMNS